MRIPTFAGVLACLAASPLAADTITYKGDDALRLKCGTMLLALASLDEKDGGLDPETRFTSRLYAEVLLAPLPGTPGEKKRAIAAMLERTLAGKSGDELLRDYKRTLPRCAKFFPSDG